MWIQAEHNVISNPIVFLNQFGTKGEWVLTRNRIDSKIASTSSPTFSESARDKKGFLKRYGREIDVHGARTQSGFVGEHRHR